MTHYRTAAYLLGWYAATTTLFTAILSPVFLSDCKIFFCTLGKEIWFVGKQFLQWADYAGHKGSGIIDAPFSETVYWIMAGLVFALNHSITIYFDTVTGKKSVILKASNSLEQ